MEVKVGIRQLNREVVVETTESADDIASALNAAMRDDTVLRLTDATGRQVFVPTEAIGYVEIGQENARPVGFGAL